MMRLQSSKARRILGSYGRKSAHRILESLSLYTGINLLAPTSLTFDLTDRCQLRCPTCTKWKTPPEAQNEELTTEEWKSTILELKRWLEEYSFTFAGGEPFLRQDIFRIISFAEDNGIPAGVITNGCGFASLARKTVATGLESLIVSLNGVDPSTHDFTRGVKGAYNKTLKFIREVNSQRKKLESELQLFIQSILMPSNCDEAVDLVRWVQEEELDGIQFQPMDPLGSFHSYYSIGSASAKGVNNEWYRSTLISATKSQRLSKAIDELIAQKKRGYPILDSLQQLEWMKTYYRNPKELLHLKCKIGLMGFNIDPYGYVRLCFDRKPVGNVRSATPKQLYNSRRTIENRHSIIRCNSPCHWLLFLNN